MEAILAIVITAILFCFL